MNFHNLRDKLGRFRPVKKNDKKLRTAKPKAKKSHHILNVFLLDDTFSMQGKERATVEGFNKVLEDAASASSKTGVKSTDVLALFAQAGHFEIQERIDSLYCTNFAYSPLTLHKAGAILYNPKKGPTALWWALCEAIKFTEKKLKELPKDTKVILTIFTDGDNNTAWEWESVAKEQVKAKQKLDWVINFIGAGEKAYIDKISQSIGIFAANTMNYSNDSKGTRKAFNKMSASRMAYTSNVAAGTASNVGFFANQ